MTSLMDNALQKPCMEYKSKFVPSELEKVKLIQDYDGGRKKEKKCPTFSGKEGIEGLLYVEERYRKIARQLDFDTGPELYDGFEEVLTDSAEEHWENIISGITEANKTVARFDQSMEQFYLKYCDSEARDVLIKYLRDVRRPVKEDPQTFADRMETLVRYANKLPGRSPRLTPEETKTNDSQLIWHN